MVESKRRVSREGITCMQSTRKHAVHHTMLGSMQESNFLNILRMSAANLLTEEMLSNMLVIFREQNSTKLAEVLVNPDRKQHLSKHSEMGNKVPHRR